MKIVLVFLCSILLLSGCSLRKIDSSAPANTSENSSGSSSFEKETTTKQQKQDDRVVQKFGSYSLPEDWYEYEELSNSEKVFYVKGEVDSKSPPSNISVEVGINKYATSEHADFRQAILAQYSAQIPSASGIVIEGSGTNTDNGDVLYIFTLTEDACVTTQYYVVGEYKFFLVHATDFLDEDVMDVSEAADLIAKSFEWPE